MLIEQWYTSENFDHFVFLCVWNVKFILIVVIRILETPTPLGFIACLGPRSKELVGFSTLVCFRGSR